MLNKPIYVMSVKTALRKSNNMVEKLSKTITTGLEAGQLITAIRKQGLINLAFYKSLHTIIVKGIATTLGTEEGQKDAQLVTSIVEKHKELTAVLLSLPFIYESLFLYMSDGLVRWPPNDLMSEAGVTLSKIMKGVTPMGDFWIMNKLKNDMTDIELNKMPKPKQLLMAAQTV